MLKTWLIEVLVKKGGPSAIRGAILGISGWLLMREGVLSSFGIVSDAAAHTTTIKWDQLNIALVGVLPAVLAAVIKLVNHEGANVVQKQLTKEPPQ